MNPLNRAHPTAPPLDCSRGQGGGASSPELRTAADQRGKARDANDSHRKPHETKATTYTHPMALIIALKDARRLADDENRGSGHGHLDDDHESLSLSTIQRTPELLGFTMTLIDQELEHELAPNLRPTGGHGARWPDLDGN